jgi:hypothetical protein
MKHFGMRDMPRCCVDVRWTMQAKLGFEPDRNSTRHVWTEQMDWFRELPNMANTFLFRASMSTEESQRVILLMMTLWVTAMMRPAKMASILWREVENLVICLHIFHRPIKLLLVKSSIHYWLNPEVHHVIRGLSHSTRDSILSTEVIIRWRAGIKLSSDVVCLQFIQSFSYETGTINTARRRNLPIASVRLNPETEDQRENVGRSRWAMLTPHARAYRDGLAIGAAVSRFWLQLNFFGMVKILQ